MDVPTPDFILDLRAHIGNSPLWIPGCTGVVLRNLPDAGETGSAATAPEPEVLLVRRADDGRWTPVTGIVDPGEEPAVACAREVLEEAGVVATPVRILSVEVVGPVTYENGDVSSYVDTSFLLEYVSGEPYPADGENSEARFVPLSELPPMNERFERTIARALSGEIPAWFRS